MLLEESRGGDDASGSTRVRRFRIARLSFDAPSSDPSERFEYLKQPHD
jgi:hypothetical protein